ncbi:anaerobic ribonucleoside-triphosphate reductase activating protein [Methanobrevibacter olleyae]|uniref:Anaerobic ribonucleoside-triphosphate reductase activating protein n=1 Tax=Methanobrevibacter olleyae TaxID=294671 RepID=A0A126QZ75_METOL|nr:anaerobic ribonucleoside-triphosphate reductase activating protein [Methanobrevibacter olleyae]AMK14685.1 anaerobic ribonucleoside-triphosphate reductase activating protein [Methanobrevibacter olleyae]SFL55146.1 pyruvate formate lyase activating enzyme [Methanobrevibacter olleyae]
MEYSATVTSSIEYPKNMSFVIFLAKCPLKCPYCSNSEILERGTEISLEEIYEKIDDSALFIDAVVISGGEPLVQYEDVIEIFKYVKEIGLKTKLDTSGVYPDRLRKILDLDLVDYVAMDVKAPSDKYNEIIKADIGDKVRECMKIVNEHEDVILECRTTYCPALLKEEDLFTIANEVDCDLYTLQQFRNRCVLDESLAEAEEPNPHDMENIAKKIKKLHPNQNINVKTAEFGQKSV